MFPILNISYTENKIFLVFPIFGISYIENEIFLIFLILDISYIENTIFLIFPIFDTFHIENTIFLMFPIFSYRKYNIYEISIMSKISETETVNVRHKYSIVYQSRVFSDAFYPKSLGGERVKQLQKIMTLWYT